MISKVFLLERYIHMEVELNLVSSNRFFKIALNAVNDIDDKDPNLMSYHGAVIVRGGQILSIGVNKCKKNGFIKAYAHHDFCNTHAECDAILKARKKIDLTNSKIYVLRVRRDGKLSNSRPCAMCLKAMKHYGIKRAFYTIDNDTYAVMKVA